jgi:formate hydrogenlyase subunit 3/multisubunit Na+/H+ antiporter MnhD subunit
MNSFILGLVLLLTGGLCAWGMRRFSLAAGWMGTAGAVLGSLMGLSASFRVLIKGSIARITIPWPLPYAAIDLAIDPLSAFFMIPLFILATAAALYGELYLRDGANKTRRGEAGFLINMLVLSMALVLAARNTILFLISWELMALSSFALVIFDDTDDSVRKAGWSYAIASQAGTAFLLVFFILLGRGSTSFSGFSAFPSTLWNPVFFVLALIGFGTKASFVPLHIWLPRAHPAAPSHVSALMSGVMIKMGIYGILRTLLILGPLPVWCSWLMILLGLSSGILGILFALAQDDLKRMLAYSSVENVGIIALGIGLGMLGQSYGLLSVSLLGFGGAIFHVLNHALFKGLLFLAAGNVLHATHTRRLEKYGGLINPLPWTAASFLVGSAAICGLPPFNGFAGEFLIYFGAFRAIVDSTAAAPVALGLVVGLAFVGALALACFAKTFSVVFLGHPRSPLPAPPCEAGQWMMAPVLFLASACLFIGVAAPGIAPFLTRVAAPLAGIDSAVELPCTIRDSLSFIPALALLIALVLITTLARARILHRREIRSSETWGCGYTAPSPRMQYTASSFASPILRFFTAILRTRESVTPVQGPFPAPARLEVETSDVFENMLFESPAKSVAARMNVFRKKVQHGHMNLYVLYIAITLLALLLWKLS